MSLSRREFLVSSAVAMGVGCPGVFRRIAYAAPGADQPGGKETILVVVQLTGGNDGLNTVIPFRDSAYKSARPKLKQPAAQVKKINEDLAFHPVMEGFAKLHENSRLAIVQGVGYAKPNRSHFASMDIWHKATKAKEQSYGWLGRTRRWIPGSGQMYVGRGEGPLALFSPVGHAPSLTSLEDYQLRVGSGGDRKRTVIEGFARNESQAESGDLLDLVRKSAQETYRSSAQLRRVKNEYDTPVNYPQTGLAQRMKLIAQLIDADVPERVFYTQLDGFDTHATQAPVHARLLEELSGAVAAFQEDISQHGHGKRVMVMTFSEFGRRVRENGSDGTDHGAASQMFLIGERVNAGVIGDHPSLTDLEQGDLKFHTDFRQVYATMLESWLGVPAKEVLGEDYKTLDLVKSA